MAMRITLCQGAYEEPSFVVKINSQVRVSNTIDSGSLIASNKSLLCSPLMCVLMPLWATTHGRHIKLRNLTIDQSNQNRH